MEDEEKYQVVIEHLRKSIEEMIKEMRDNN